jgi:hypothetical protein
MAHPEQEETHLVHQEVLRLKAKAWGVSFGLLCGLGLFVATLILVLKGGERVGPHLGLLAVFLPGYRVSVAGAFLGFVYLFVIGYGIGRLIGTVYNRLAGRTL